MNVRRNDNVQRLLNNPCQARKQAMRNFLFLLFLAVAVLSCKKQNPHNDAETRQVTVGMDDCTAIDSVGKFSSICLEQVNDSRCPANANCGWKGIAVAKFLFRTDNTQHNIALSTDIRPQL